MKKVSYAVLKVAFEDAVRNAGRNFMGNRDREVFLRAARDEVAKTQLAKLKPK